VSRGLLHRVGVERTKDAEALGYAGQSLISIARECLEQRGISTRGMAPARIAQRALIETSDLSSIVATVAGRSLRAGYDYSPRTFTECFRRAMDVQNFKNVERHALSDAPELDLVAEGGVYTEGALSASKATYSVLKYGKILAVTWESVINDDLDSLSRIPHRMGSAAARREGDVVWGKLTSNPTMPDSTALFHASRGNTTTDVLDAAGLEAGRAWFRARTAPGGTPINIAPRYLIVGAEGESTAEKLIFENASITSRSEILAGSLRSLQIIVEPRIVGPAWYLAADPNQVDTIEFAYLAGEDGVTLEEHKTFDVDDLKLKARLVIGAGAIDHVGLYRSTGTGL
ncbi:MAG: peptidase U37, partial [Polyangiaceae bacterium]|nr:peptidase U37 [Polyangiaceae bacterium]